MAEKDSIGTRSFRKEDPIPPEVQPAAQHSTPRSHLTTDSLARLPRTKIAEDEPDWQVPNLPAAIGRFEVLDLLGHGGFGFVYRAYDPELNRPVALKVPRADAVSEQFLVEARSAAQLKHPNIVTIYDVGRSADGQVFIAMEYVDGPNLAAWAEQSSALPVDVARMTAKVADAVHYAHTAGFVHRDLKPGNILIDRDGTPKVADFGLALHESQQHLKQGEVAGTPAFMAPEQITGATQQIDGRTDIWALGVILYRLLSGRQPFDGKRGDLQDQILNCDPKPLRQIDDSIPLELDQICHQCLEKLPAERPSTAKDVAQALEDFCHSSAIEAPTEPDTRIAEAAGRRPIAQWLAVSGGLCAVLLGGWLTNSYWGATIAVPTPDHVNPPPPQATIELPAEAPTVAQRMLEQDRSPVLTPRDPRWIPFRGPAKAVLWREHDKEDSWAVDAQTGRLAVRSEGACLFSMCQGAAQSTSLRTTARLEVWEGRIGLFWGLRERIDGRRECLMVRVGRSLPDAPFEIEIAEVEIDWHPQLGDMILNDRVWWSQSIADPVQEATVQVDLEEGAINQVLIDHEAIVTSDQFAHLAIPAYIVTGKEAGLFIDRGSVLFKDFLTRE